MKRYRQMYRLVKYIEQQNREIGSDYFLKGLGGERQERMLFAQRKTDIPAFAASRWVRRSFRTMSEDDASNLMDDCIENGYITDKSGLHVASAGRDFTAKLLGIRVGMYGAVYKFHPLVWAVIGGVTTLATGALIQIIIKSV